MPPYESIHLGTPADGPMPSPLPSSALSSPNLLAAPSFGCAYGNGGGGGGGVGSEGSSWGSSNGSTSPLATGIRKDGSNLKRIDGMLSPRLGASEPTVAAAAVAGKGVDVDTNPKLYSAKAAIKSHETRSEDKRFTVSMSKRQERDGENEEEEKEECRQGNAPALCVHGFSHDSPGAGVQSRYFHS